MSVDKHFGKEGFQVALVARNPEKLQSMVEELKELDIESSYYVADIYKKDQVDEALTGIKAKYEKIDVLEFSPMTWDYPPTSVLELAAENVRYHFEGQVISVINIVNNVVPDMIEYGEGALLFTTGISAFYPYPPLANIGIAMSGLRNYLLNLYTALSPKGILVAHRSLGVQITAGTGKENDPDVIADMWYRAYSEKLGGEEVYPKEFTLAALGI